MVARMAEPRLSMTARVFRGLHGLIAIVFLLSLAGTAAPSEALPSGYGDERLVFVTAEDPVGCAGFQILPARL
jgi:hypothetical protein